ILLLHNKFDGFSTTVRGVFTYRVNDEGLLTNLRGYWNMDGMQITKD
ncbi:MAG TPA: steroid delta-isomerase, partial [Mycobacterium sp.]|nr:steroid delta-isomerase [Mycobacterium sp.]